jgi:tRNA threonylcarbamoyladenosine biosynthesis protein TsaB
MPSLRQLLAEHAPLLVLDAASARIQVGVLEPAGSARWAVSEAEAGVGLFLSLESLAVDISSIGAFAYAEVPGSVLGIRTAAMAIRTWQVLKPRPAFAYNALAVVAEGLGEPNLTIIADARRGLWHSFRLGQPPAKVPSAELGGPLATPEGFRQWEALPGGVRMLPYDLAGLLARTADAALFRQVQAPDSAPGGEKSYAMWTPQIHRAR